MSKTRFLFVTGTDTDVGKTEVAAALLRKMAAAGLTTAAIKPVAAGCEQSDGQWVNSDALKLQAEATLQLDYRQVNPVALEPAIAPHIAAAQSGKRITVDQLAGYCRGIAIAHRPDVVLVEGAGGWLCPLNERETLAELATVLAADVMLVVGMRLGCLNHALLTAAAVRQSRLSLVGWVANCIAPDMPVLEENIACLRSLLPAPCWGVLPRADIAAGADITHVLSEALTVKL